MENTVFIKVNKTELDNRIEALRTIPSIGGEYEIRIINKIISESPVIETYGAKKPFIVANVREVLDQLNSEEISFSRAVELFNEISFQWHKTITI